ncbi:Pentapeptide repeats (9 copies) [Xylophilus ampelinus]|nr:Pentapeptide repeats (9 copies) [Xylophilus ampelinus]
MSKPNIKTFGKKYSYLKDPELRRREIGDKVLVIEGAEFSGVDFQYLTWENIRFVDCDFAGGYEIKLKALSNANFENCELAGIFSFGVLSKVRFFKCLSGFNSNWGGDGGSVVFEECQFIGNDPNRNHQGAIGNYGQASFINCRAKWFKLTADSGMTARGCEFEDVAFSPDSGPVLIENCKLRGTFDMVPASLQSLTIRDTQIDLLDLTGATVKEDVVMERIKGGALKVGVRGARSLTLRDSQIYGPADNFNPRVFSMAADSADELLIDNVQFASGLQDVVKIGNTGPLSESQWSAVPQAVKTIIRNSKLPRIDASWLETQHLQLQGNEIGSLDLSNSRISQLEISGNTIGRSVDFSHTQVKQANVQVLAKDQAKLEGSNIKLPR